MTRASSLRRVVVAGGSIAAVTAAEGLRLQGFDGDITLLAEEDHPPYSRVPLSKGILAGREALGSATLPPVAGDVTVRLGATAARLHEEHRRVVLADGEEVPYDGLVIATGARARRLAGPGQTGECVVRTRDDATRLAARLDTAGSVIVVGAGFLGMEIASTCAVLGKTVTVVDRDPPLRRLVGEWLADLVVQAARERGVEFALAPDGVQLLGRPEVQAVDCGDRIATADVIVSAVGDLPNTEWLADSRLPLHGGLVVDERCRVAPDIVAAGDVTVSRTHGGPYRRSPHWTSAVVQGQLAAAALVHGRETPLPRPDPYYWTEQFGLDIKISGEIPHGQPPTVLAGDPRQGSALLQWSLSDRPVAAVAINHRLPVVTLKRLGGRAAGPPVMP